MFKRFFSFVAVLVLGFCLLIPGFAFAGENEELGYRQFDLNLTQWGGTGPTSSDVSSFAASDADINAAKAAVLAGLEEQKESINLREYKLTYDEAVALAYDVIFDNPKLFYVDSGMSASYSLATGYVSELSPDYVSTDESIDELKAAYEAQITDALSWVPADASDPEKLKAIHDWICYHNQYDYDELNSQSAGNAVGTVNKWVHSAYGAMVVGKSVCQGYALAFGDLCNRLGISWKYVQGMPDGVIEYPDGTSEPNYTHGWNAVQVDGYWYFVDVTWDDPSASSTDQTPYQRYFLKSDACFSDHESWNFDLNPTSTQYDNKEWQTYTASAPRPDPDPGDDDPDPAPAPSATGVEGFVERLYYNVMGRVADEAGKAAQVAGMRSMGAAQITYNFYNSKEFANKSATMTNAEIVENVYQTMLGRAADEGGLAMWEGYLDNGMSACALVAGFAESQEFANVCASYGIGTGSADQLRSMLEYRDRNAGVTAFASRMYTVVLSRAAEVDGLNVQCEALIGGTACYQIAYNFFKSDEFALHGYTSEQVVRIAYAALLGRDKAAIDADTDGIAYWVERLEKNGLKDMVMGFCQSNEFEAICQDCGMTSGMR